MDEGQPSVRVRMKVDEGRSIGPSVGAVIKNMNRPR